MGEWWMVPAAPESNILKKAYSSPKQLVSVYWGGGGIFENCLISQDLITPPLIFEKYMAGYTLICSPPGDGQKFDESMCWEPALEHKPYPTLCFPNSLVDLPPCALR